MRNELRVAITDRRDEMHGANHALLFVERRKRLSQHRRLPHELQLPGPRERGRMNDDDIGNELVEVLFPVGDRSRRGCRRDGSGLGRGPCSGSNKNRERCETGTSTGRIFGLQVMGRDRLDARRVARPSDLRRRVPKKLVDL